MALTATAEQIMSLLPVYYRGEPLWERMVQARANEIDRRDALLDRAAVELHPGAATDSLRTLELWEQTFGLPAQPVGATVAERQQALLAALRNQPLASGANWSAALDGFVGGRRDWQAHRDSRLRAPEPGVVAQAQWLAVQIPWHPQAAKGRAMIAFIERATPAHLKVEIGVYVNQIRAGSAGAATSSFATQMDVDGFANDRAYVTTTTVQQPANARVLGTFDDQAGIDVVGGSDGSSAA